MLGEVLHKSKATGLVCFFFRKLNCAKGGFHEQGEPRKIKTHWWNGVMQQLASKDGEYADMGYFPEERVRVKT